MKETLKKKWESLTPEKKKKAVLFAIALVVLFFGFFSYKPKKKPVSSAQGSSSKEISLDNGLLKKSEYMDVQKQLADFKNQIKDQNAAIANGVKASGTVENGKDLKGLNKQLTQTQAPIPKYFPPPFSNTRPSAGASGASFAYPPPQFKDALKKDVKPSKEVIGDIEVVQGAVVQEKDTGDKKGKDSKKKDTVYLPTSFMEATLLSGLDAPTSDNAKEGDVPVLLRIKAPAVLPNDVKANLKGCFVIAEGHGSLADERAHMRLVTLSCIAKNGKAVIDQKVKGFIVDQDGKVGLRGRVVSKMGAAVGRSLIAGFFGGLGSAIQSQTMTTSISGLGAVQTIQPSKILEAGAGGGISQAAQELQKFYLDLAKQSLPVIEIGATRKVTLVISKGVNLEIKNFCRMGDKCEN